MSYGIFIDKLCLREPANIQLDSPVNGELIVSLNKNDKWSYLTSLKVVKGKTSFIPSIVGEYKFDFTIAGKLAGSTKKNCNICSLNRPFEIPLDMLTQDYDIPLKLNIEEINVEDLAGYGNLTTEEKEKVKTAVGMATFYENALKSEKIENIIKIRIFIIAGIITLIFINAMLRKLIRKRNSYKQNSKKLEKFKKQFNLTNK